MLRPIKILNLASKRNFKNFGHKREPIPLVTTLWHGFLTCTFIGLGLEWNVWVLFTINIKFFDNVKNYNVANLKPIKKTGGYNGNIRKKSSWTCWKPLPFALIWKITTLFFFLWEISEILKFYLILSLQNYPNGD